MPKIASTSKCYPIGYYKNPILHKNKSLNNILGKYPIQIKINKINENNENNISKISFYEKKFEGIEYKYDEIFNKEKYNENIKKRIEYLKNNKNDNLATHLILNYEKNLKNVVFKFCYNDYENNKDNIINFLYNYLNWKD